MPLFLSHNIIIFTSTTWPFGGNAQIASPFIHLQNGHPVAMLRLPRYFYIYKWPLCGNAKITTALPSLHLLTTWPHSGNAQIDSPLLHLQHGQSVAMLRLPHHFYTDKIATGGNAQIAISSPLLDLQHGHMVVMLRLPNQLQNGHHTGGNAQVASPLLDLQNCHQWQCSD